MKLTPCIALLALWLCFSSCSQGGSQSALQKEAEARAKAWWEASVAKCGEDYYTRRKWGDVVLGRFVKEDELYQLKNATYYIKETPLTEASKLNGIEWQGKIVFVATAYRKRHTDNSGWSAWADGLPQYESDFARSLSSSLLDKGFNKVKGQWSVGGNGQDKDGEPSHIKPDCSQIPPG